MSDTITKDLVIIGSGPGGYVGAIYAARKGLKVSLIEKRWLGGTCLNAGCIPTKALIKAVEVYDEAKNSSKFGIDIEGVTANWPNIQNQKIKVTDSLRQGIDMLLTKNGVDLIRGEGSFAKNGTILVSSVEGNKTLISKHIIIATGAKTKHLRIPGIDLPVVIDSEQILSLKSMPTSLTIIGGGVIGMEFAFIFGRLGVKVTVIEFLPQILPMVDLDIVQRLTRYAKMANITVITNAAVLSIMQNDNGMAIVKYRQNDAEKSAESEVVLEAVGRIPELNNLGLENINITLAKNGGIQVDSQMRTNVENVYAIGDCTNLVQLAHVASHQAFVAVDNILGIPTKMDYNFIPSVIFTSPEIATVGKSEKNLQDAGISYQVSKIPYGSNGKALILNQPIGFVKLLRETESKKLVGASAFGVEANALIATLTVALNNNLSVSDIKKTIFAHPTLSEIIHDSALALDNEAIHFFE
ncbi:MAG: dihydrolipoyl dehydrogenase [Candidatus Izemoplasmatales bacterium]|nr:dihydrolipoyl dehydrogenase [Candidatus Izemoplasmatales bacterium]